MSTAYEALSPVDVTGRPRTTTPTLPDAEELANLEGRAERWEALAMRLETEIAELREELKQSKEETDRIMRALGACELDRRAAVEALAGRKA
jgi:chromosome segregation ATPase